MLAMLEEELEEREGEGHTLPIGGLDGKTNVPDKTLSKLLAKNSSPCHCHGWSSAAKSDSLDP